MLPISKCFHQESLVKSVLIGLISNVCWVSHCEKQPHFICFEPHFSILVSQPLVLKVEENVNESIAVLPSCLQSHRLVSYSISFNYFPSWGVKAIQFFQCSHYSIYYNPFCFLWDLPIQSASYTHSSGHGWWNHDFYVVFVASQWP